MLEKVHVYYNIKNKCTLFLQLNTHSPRLNTKDKDCGHINVYRIFAFLPTHKEHESGSSYVNEKKRRKNSLKKKNVEQKMTACLWLACDTSQKAAREIQNGGKGDANLSYHILILYNEGTRFLRDTWSDCKLFPFYFSAGVKGTVPNV